MADKQLEQVTALVIGDPHFKVSNVLQSERMAAEILRIANEKQPNFIVVLGDTLDRHEAIHVSPLTRATDFLRRLKEVAPVYLLIGNHDLKNNRQYLSTEHPFNALKEWSNIVVVDTVVEDTIAGRQFVFVPYVPPGRFEEALSTVDWRGASAIFAHQEFRGAAMGAILSTEGDVWRVDYPLVICGHFHDYQQPQPNLIYVGTPIQHAFGDSPDKGISHFSWSTMNGSYNQERIPLDVAQKFTIELTVSELESYSLPGMYEKQELRFIVSGETAQLRAARSHPQIAAWRKAGYKIVYVDRPGERAVTLPTQRRLPFSQALVLRVGATPLQELYRSIVGATLTPTPTPTPTPTLRLIVSTSSNTPHNS